RRPKMNPIPGARQKSDRASPRRVERCNTIDRDLAVAGELDATALGQLTQGDPGGVLSHARARRTPSAYLSASALITLSVISIRVLANTTGSCKIRSNFSAPAIC